jgi:hypothetical protein
MTPLPFVTLFASVLLQRTLQGINKMRTSLPMQLIPCCLLMWCAGPARAYLPVPGRAVCQGHDRPSTAPPDRSVRTGATQCSRPVPVRLWAGKPYDDAAADKAEAGRCWVQAPHLVVPQVNLTGERLRLSCSWVTWGSGVGVACCCLSAAAGTLLGWGAS